MATLQNQISPQQARQNRAAQAVQQKQQAQVDSSSTPAANGLSPEMQIAQTRQQIQQIKSQFVQTRRAPGQIVSRQARAQSAIQQKQIREQERAYEIDVAKSMPEQARPEYKAQLAQEARAVVNNKITSIDSQIQQAKQRIQDYEKKAERTGRDYGNSIKDYEKEIKVLEAQKRGWTEGIGDENSLIKNYYSGYLEKKADYNVQRQESKFKQSQLKQEQISKLAKEIGISERAVPRYLEELQKLKNAPSEIQYYSTPLKAYFDPLTGEQIMKSIPDAVVKAKQYVPVDVTGYNTKTGQYVVSSPTGLLGAEQTKLMKLIEQNPKLVKLFNYGGQMVSKPLPTEFLFGNDQSKKDSPISPSKNLLYDLSKMGRSAYEIAQTVPEVKQLQREYYDDPQSFAKKYKYVFTPEGKILSTGEVSAVIAPKEFEQGANAWKRLFKPEEYKKWKEYRQKNPYTEFEKSGLTSLDLAFGASAVGKLPVKKAATFLFSGLITKPVDVLYQKTYQPKSFLGQFVKAGLTSLLVMRSPTVASAYGYSFLKSGVKQPKETWQSMLTQYRERPGELAGFVIGGKLIKKGIEFVESKFRGVPTRNINLPGYGEVVVQTIPKYGEVVWVKGKFAQSEKINIMKQIDNLLGKKKRIFTQVSSQGIPTKAFTNTKNLGFEVSQIENPLRGFYEAPPFDFLKKYNPYVKTQAGATSFYSRLAKRDSILPNPVAAIKGLFSGGEFTTQRPFEYLRRTYKSVKTPDWVRSIADSIQKGKGIPKKYVPILEKYYKAFLKEPLEWPPGSGQYVSGKVKADLVNRINLRAKGDGIKLKVYASLLQYQKMNKVGLVGGPELLSGVQPFGPESQLVSALGTRYYLKSAKDLRKGIKPSILDRTMELLTGTKRGQYVARIDGSLVEIQPLKRFAPKIRDKIVKKKLGMATENQIDKFISGTLNRRREYASAGTPPRPILSTTQRQSTRRLEIRRVVPEIVRREIRREERRTIERPILRRDIRRVEIRRDIRGIVRRPEIRREIRREERRSERTAPRRIITRRQDPSSFLRRIDKTTTRQSYKKVVTLKKKKPTFSLLPTVTQQVYGLKREGGRVGRTTGFEIARL
jgi:hypothetical protein